MRRTPTPRRRRRRWLDERQRAGKVRPRPVVVRATNAASVSYRPERAAGVWRKSIDKPGKAGTPDVVLAVELADVDAKAEGAAAGMQVFQRGPVGAPDSALGIAVRRGRAKLSQPGLDAGVPATREGGGIRARPILHTSIVFAAGTAARWARGFVLGHAHPGRAPLARLDYLRRFFATPGAIHVGDLNIGHRWAARLTGRRVYSAGVLHIAVPRWIPSKRAGVVDVDSDHLALDVVLWPTPKESK
ncbi:hypothetical protein [Pimelobacter simplex]|uniref:hypothetical protein n=1 Tax=Nocardioides simplex TaxID=2045 RepID=UPI00214FC2E6|nr:hypothetical protein [Pimelobacter simplex]UUW92665.1 hypothetical protein M0M43_14635 [Pimelobacter simplex]UUW96493.1 hypothetical protein M0M48_03270 [Pimelobacter simplex]